MLPSTTQTRVDRRLLATDKSRDLRTGQSLPVGELEQLLIGELEPAKRLEQGMMLLASAADRRRTIAAEVDRRSRERIEASVAMKLAKVLEHDHPRDAQHESSKRAGALIAVALLDQTQKGARDQLFVDVRRLGHEVHPHLGKVDT